MRAVIVALRLRDRRRRRAGRRQQSLHIHVHRPVRHHQSGQDRGHRHGAGCRLGAPGDGDGRDGQDDKGGERGRIVPARQHQERGGQQIDHERQGREAVDRAGHGRRPVEQAADQKRGDQREAGERVEDMRAQRDDGIGLRSRQRPQRAEHDRRDGEPEPHAKPRQRESGRIDDGDVNIQRPEIRLGGRNQHRRQIGADHAQAGERGSMQQRGAQGEQRHGAEQDESGCRRQESVEPVRRIDGGISDSGAGRGQRAGNMRRRHAGERRKFLGAPRPFAGGDQRKRQQGAEKNPHARADQALLDRIAHQKDAAERERHAADPDHPAGAEFFFEADFLRGRWHRRGRRKRHRRGRTRWWLRWRRGLSRCDSNWSRRRRRPGPRRCRRRSGPHAFQCFHSRVELPQQIAIGDASDQGDNADDRRSQQQQHDQSEQVHRSPRPPIAVASLECGVAHPTPGRGGTARLLRRDSPGRWSRWRRPCGRCGQATGRQATRCGYWASPSARRAAAPGRCSPRRAAD